MTIKLVSINEYYIPDDDISRALFDHLYDDSEQSLDSLTYFKVLAKAHGWKVKVRKARKEDYEQDE